MRGRGSEQKEVCAHPQDIHPDTEEQRERNQKRTTDTKDQVYSVSRRIQLLLLNLPSVAHVRVFCAHSPVAEKPLHELVLQILPTCRDYSIVTHFIDRESPEYG